MPDPTAPVKPRLLYLSGAPRISTREDAAEPGPRTHIVGTIAGFRACGWEVRSLVVGDHLRLDRGRTDGGSRKSGLRRIATDLIRLGVDAGARIAALRHARNIDLCYERLAALQALGGAVQRMAGVPWILETQALMWRDARERDALALTSLAQRRERNAYRSCSLVVAVSDAVRHDVIDFAGIDPDKVLVVPNGVDTTRFMPPAGGRPVPRDRLRLVFVGTLLRWQGLDRLLSAIAQARRAGVPVELSIIGDGAEREPLAAQVRNDGLEEAVRFVGRVPHPQVAAALAEADLGFSGQRRTSGRTMHHSPLKIYEYAASGLPFIASAFADALDVCPPDAHWLLFDPETIAGPQPAIRAAWERRASLPAIGARLRQEAEARLSWRARVTGMLQCLDGILPHGR